MLRWISALALALSVTAAQAADFKSVSRSSIGCTLKISGTIEHGDAERLEAFLNDFDRFRGRICFDSPGGSYPEGIRIAKKIYETSYTVPTGVGAGDRCESACFLAFMAGAHSRREDVSAVSDRVIHPTALVGFHAPALEIPKGDYSEAEVSEAYRVALASTADLVALRAEFDTYVFRDLLLDEMLRVPPGEMRYVETVADATLFGIVVYPVALPAEFSQDHSAQACRALGRMSEDFDMSEPYGPRELVTSEEAVRFRGAFNYGESPSSCEIVYLLNGEPSGMSGDIVPDWSLGQARVEDEHFRGDAFEIAAYVHYPFETAIRELPRGSHPAITDSSRIRALSRAQ